MEALKGELKAWEKQFQEREGRVPGRADIKADSLIAAKYKAYNRLRDDIKRQKPSVEATEATETPMKPSQAVSTPSKSKASPSKSTTDTPGRSRAGIAASQSTEFVKPKDLKKAIESLTPRRKGIQSPFKNGVGPTPELSGRTLGIFDGLRDQDGTPVKPGSLLAKLSAAKSSGMPSRSRPVMDSPSKPMSMPPPASLISPTEVRSASQYDTPTFFRTRSLDVEESPKPLLSLLPKKSSSRGLSDLISDLRTLEDEAHNEDEEIMREMEAEMLAEAEEQGEQAPDGEGEEEGRVWKKKGRKRDHRRVIMRPAPERPVDELEDELVGGDDRDDDSGSEFGGGDGDDDPDNPFAEPKKRKASGVAENEAERKKRPIKAKGGLVLDAQVSNNFVRMKNLSRGKGRYGKGGRESFRGRR
ncbi:tRNA (guanine(9)-N(1))-methyltransferase [Saitoella coloradoensis]